MASVSFLMNNFTSYTVHFNPGAATMDVVVMMETANGVIRRVTNRITVAKAIATAIQMCEIEAYIMDKELFPAPGALTGVQKKAADIIADVKRRCALYGFTGQAVKFSVIDRADRFGVHFTTADGEDITGFAHFRDRAEMAQVIDELNRILNASQGLI